MEVLKAEALIDFQRSGVERLETVIILEIVTGNIDPQVNAIGSLAFLTSITLVFIAQVVLMTRNNKEKL